MNFSIYMFIDILSKIFQNCISNSFDGILVVVEKWFLFSETGKQILCRLDREISINRHERSSIYLYMFDNVISDATVVWLIWTSFTNDILANYVWKPP